MNATSLWLFEWHNSALWPQAVPWTGTVYWAWVALFFLGAYHGVNPGMGWLFAVSLGLQEKARRAVLVALGPLVLGHLISVGIVVAVVALLAARVPNFALRVAGAAILIGFGFLRLLRSRHPRWVGMRVGFRDLTLWSFLMASAHGAGLMLVPILLGWPTGSHTHHLQAVALLMPHGAADVPAHSMGFVLASAHVGPFASAATWFWPVAIHTLGYMLVTAVVALLVYEKLGVAILRRAWFNLDVIWAAALVVTGVLTLFV